MNSNLLIKQKATVNNQSGFLIDRFISVCSS